MSEVTGWGYLPFAVIIKWSCNGDAISFAGGNVMLGLFERGRTRLHVNMGTESRPVAAVFRTDPNLPEPDYVQEIKADLARQEQVCVDVVSEALIAYQDGLAPAGASTEAGVTAAMDASDFTAAEAALHRDVLIDLASNFAQPGERVLGVGVMSYFQPAEVVVVLTHGFAVKTRSGSYRVELDRERPNTTTQFGMYGLTLTTHASLGELHYFDGALLTPEGGRLPRFYLALRTQALASSEATDPVSKARRALWTKIATPRREPVSA
jgi:hypothetical protein